MPDKDSFQELTFRSSLIVVAALLVLTFYILFAVNATTLSISPDTSNSILISMVLIIIEVTLLALYASVRSIEHAIEQTVKKK